VGPSFVSGQTREGITRTGRRCRLPLSHTLILDYGGAFDAAWEYTCFCAIDPDRRAEYARVLHDILKPGGTLLACFYPLKEGTDGPPFPVSPGDIESALGPFFSIVEAGPPPASPERRRGLEWLVLAERP